MKSASARALAATASVVALLIVGACDGDDGAVDSVDADVDVEQDTVVEADTSVTVDTSVAADTLAAVDTIAAEDTSVEVDTTPPEAPSITLTVSGIPGEMNGSEPYPGADGQPREYTLRVNRARTSLDVIADGRAGPVDWDSLDVSCAVEGGDPLGLGAFEEAEIRGEEARRYVVRADNAWPDGARIACEADVSGPGGAAASGVTFDAAALPAHLDPFAEVDPWLVVLSRDIFELSVTELPDGTLGLRSVHVPGGNGVADFDEPFFVLGLLSQDDPEAAAVVKGHLLRVVREHANRIYGLDDLGRPTVDGVPLRLWWEGDEGAPTPADFGGDEALSMIALGGDGKPSDQDAGTFGRALIDWNNQDVEDDTAYGLGVFPTAVVRVIVGQELGTYLLDGMIPALGGTPIGEAPGDEAFIGLDVDPSTISDAGVRERATLYDLAIRMGGMALASILTHEIGHSLGLVPYGPPPEGLFAGVEGPAFRESFAPDAHVDTEGLNIMQTGGSVNWIAAFSEVPEFNPLNWAYLRRELVIGEP